VLAETSGAATAVRGGREAQYAIIFEVFQRLLNSVTFCLHG
jgi:hypothetical protein